MKPVPSKTPDATPCLADLEERYLLFRLRGQRGLKRRTLPLTVGTAGECDVVLHAASSAPLAYVVHSDQAGRLVCYNVKTAAAEPTSAIKDFGIEILGVGRGTAPAQGAMRTSVGEALQREAAWFAGVERLPPRLKRLLGERLPQPLRLGAWAAGLALLGAGVVWMSGEPTYPDLSKAPLTMTFGTPRLEIVGASATRHGYERGATIKFEAPKKVATASTLLSFKSMALNKPKELKLYVNGQEVYVSNVDPACVSSECVKQVQVPKGVVKPGNNVLELKHDPAAGSYMVQAILIEPLPAISLEERELVDRWTQLARRFYDERGIVTDNLLQARIHVEKTIDLLGRRSPGEDTEGRLAAARVLKQEIDVELERAIKDAWADVGVHERLGRPEEASKALGILLRLYPDPSSPEHQTVKAKLEALKEPTP